MAEFKSGRTRRLTMNGQWQCPVEVEYRCTREWPTFPNRFATYREKWPEFLEVRGLGMKASMTTTSLFSSWPTNPACSATWTDQFAVVQEVVLGDGYSFQQSATGAFSTSYSVADLSVLSVDPSANYFFWADVEEWFEVVDPIAETDGSGFPNFGGASVADGVTGRGIRFFERLRVGGEIGVSLGGLAPLSLSQTITQAIADEFGIVDYTLDRRGKMWVENDSGLAVIAGLVAGEPVVTDYLESTGAGSFDGRTSFVLTMTQGLAEGGEAYGYLAGLPATKFAWRGDVFAGQDILLDENVVRFERRAEMIDDLDISGSAILDFEQRTWSAFGSIDGVHLPSLGFDDRRTIRHWLDGARLALNGDAPDDWRLQFRGKEWTAFTASVPGTVELDDGNSTVGWTGDGVVVGSGISLTVGAAEGSALRTFDPEIRAEAYRYLEIEVRSVGADAEDLSLIIGPKSWELRTGEDGIWVTHQVDLCRPDNLSVDWDEKESRYPLDVDGEVLDSAHWGVSEIKEIAFKKLSAGVRYEIRAIRLVRDGVARLSFLPSLRSWRDRHEGSPDLVKPLIWSEVDGRIADVFGLSKSGSNFFWKSLSGLISDLEGLGWSINPGVAVGDGYHSNLREAEMAWGSGFLTSGGHGVDRTVGTGLVVQACGLWDEVTIYPGAGDVWSDSGSFGGRTQLSTGKILRSQAWGLVLDDNGVRAGILTEFVHQSGIRGTANSDSRGFFVTALPGGRADTDHWLRIGGVESAKFDSGPRMRHRRVLREQASAGAVSFDWHPAGMAVRASISGSTVRIATKENGVAAGYSTRSVGFSAASLAIRWDLGGKLRLVLVTEEEGQIKERFSDDLGETWSMATTLAVGNVRYPGLFIHPDGRRFVYWIEADSVNGMIRDRSGGILSTVTGARSGVAERGLAVGGLDQMGGRVTIELVTVESDSIVSSLSTDGVTFS